MRPHPASRHFRRFLQKRHGPTDGLTDRRTDGRTDRRTDTPSYSCQGTRPYQRFQSIFNGRWFYLPVK